MLPVVHFVASILIVLALEINYPRKYTMILMFGVIGVLPDLDHLLPTHNGYGIFHSFLVLGILPIALLMAAFLLENNGRCVSSKYQRFFITLAVILMGHLLLDLIAGGRIPLNMGADSPVFSLGTLALLESDTLGTIVGLVDLAWLALCALVVIGHTSQKMIYAIIEGADSNYFGWKDFSAFKREEVFLPIISKPRYVKTFPLSPQTIPP